MAASAGRLDDQATACDAAGLLGLTYNVAAAGGLGAGLGGVGAGGVTPVGVFEPAAGAGVGGVLFLAAGAGFGFFDVGVVVPEPDN